MQPEYLLQLVNQTQIYKDMQEEFARKYTCVICGNPELTKSTWQNMAAYKTNEGTMVCEVDIERDMCVCSEPCRAEYVRRGMIPRHLLMRNVGVPVRFSNATLELWNKPGTMDIYKAFVDWAAGDLATGLFLTGPTGNGKTTVAAALAYELRKRELLVLFEDANTLACEANIQAIKARSLDTFLNKYLCYDVLIIDDVAQHYLSETAKTFMYQVFASAYNNKNTVVITSNLEAKQVAMSIGAERFESRINEMCQTVVFAGKDQRMNGKV
jgi:DNA replication protein DnaC